MGVDPAKMFINVNKYGNTSAASIPIALVEAIDQGRVKPDDKIALVSFGAGLTWASAVLQWGISNPASNGQFSNQTVPLPQSEKVSTPLS
jgi:3-hydroxy-3-methylglutaryl CoA synthase